MVDLGTIRLTIYGNSLGNYMVDDDDAIVKPCVEPKVRVPRGETLTLGSTHEPDGFVTSPINEWYKQVVSLLNPLNAELNPICCLLALLGAHHFLHVSRIRVKSLTLRLLMSYIYEALILDVSRSHTTTHHSR